MKPQLPETYTEILTYLRDNKNGMTTREICDEAKNRRYYQLKDTTQISYIVNALRSKKLITTSEAAGGKIHRITESGIGAIVDEAPEKEPKEESEEKSLSQPSGERITDTVGRNVYSEFSDREQTVETEPTDAPSDIIAKFDDTFGAIRSFLIEYLSNANPPAPKIGNKEIKLQVLKRLAPQFNDEISWVLAEIHDDLVQLEAQP